MSLLETVLLKIEETSNVLRPITLPALQLPLASIPHLSSFLTHITSTNVHPRYFPYVIFGAIHAARVTTVWASLTRTRSGRVGVLPDLLGYLTMAWGGGTVVSLLLGQPPSWLLSPTPWIVYTSIYLLLVPTKLSHYLVKTAPTLPFNLITAYIDGLTRGTTIASLPSAIKASGIPSTWFTDILLSGIAVSAGGWLVSGFGLHQSTWGIGIPPVLGGGILNTLDLWGGMVVGLIYSALMRHHSELSSVTNILAVVLPDDVKLLQSEKSEIEGPLVSPDTGRAICVLLLGSLLAARVVTLSALSWTAKPRVSSTSGRGKKVTKKAVEAGVKNTSIKVDNEKVVKSPTKSERKATPRKSPRAKSVASDRG